MFCKFQCPIKCTQNIIFVSLVFLRTQDKALYKKSFISFSSTLIPDGQSQIHLFMFTDSLGGENEKYDGMRAGGRVWEMRGETVEMVSPL